MKVFIMTDMEGLAGVDHWDQCYAPDDDSPDYLLGREHLTQDTNAAIAGAFDAGASEVMVMDGHGRNKNRGFVEQRLDPRAKRVWISGFNPARFQGLDESITCVAMIGQHAMAGTRGAFLDHTFIPKELCEYALNGVPVGEMTVFALYAGSYGVPLVYVSGDESLCSEAAGLHPGCITTPTKKGMGWDTCELYDLHETRRRIRSDITQAINECIVQPFRIGGNIEVRVQWAWSGRADPFEQIAGVERLDARTVRWSVQDPRDCYNWPSPQWKPLSAATHTIRGE